MHDAEKLWQDKKCEAHREKLCSFGWISKDPVVVFNSSDAKSRMNECFKGA